MRVQRGGIRAVVDVGATCTRIVFGTGVRVGSVEEGALSASPEVKGYAVVVAYAIIVCVIDLPKTGIEPCRILVHQQIARLGIDVSAVADSACLVAIGHQVG